MTAPLSDANSLALNPQSLSALRWETRRDGGQGSATAAAREFESFFLHMMLQSMRQSETSGEGLMDSQETRTFTEMLDQQIAQQVAHGKGVGVADLLLKQIEYARHPEVLRPEARPYHLPPVTALPDVTSLPSSGAMKALKSTPTLP